MPQTWPLGADSGGVKVNFTYDLGAKTLRRIRTDLNEILMKSIFIHGRFPTLQQFQQQVFYRIVHCNKNSVMQYNRKNSVMQYNRKNSVMQYNRKTVLCNKIEKTVLCNTIEKNSVMQYNRKNSVRQYNRKKQCYAIQ